MLNTRFSFRITVLDITKQEYFYKRAFLTFQVDKVFSNR
jgi:hypothetical protein